MKLLGAALILVCGVLLGNELRGRLKARERLMRELEELCGGIGDIIRFERLPLDRIMRKLSGGSCELADCCALYICDGEDFHSAWKRAVVTSADMRYLSAEERRLVAQMGAQLGYGDWESELKMLSGWRERFSEMRESAAAELAGKGKMYSSCSVLGSAFIAILFL